MEQLGQRAASGWQRRPLPFGATRPQRRKAHLLDRTGRKANDDQATVPGDALERRDDHADRVVDNVGAVALRDLHDLLLPPFVVVVDTVVGSKALGDFELLLRTGSRDDLGADGFRDLNRGETDCEGEWAGSITCSDHSR